MSQQSMLFLAQEDIRNLLSMPEAIDLMRDAFRQISAGTVSVPVRTAIDIPGHNADALFMPVHSSENNMIALKMVSVFRNNPKIQLPLIHAMIVLMDGTTGQPLAVMDGEYITALRTGAGSGLATDLLARKDAHTMAMFGAGVQSHTQVAAVCQVRPIKEIVIFDKNANAAQDLAVHVNQVHGADVTVNPDDAYLAQCDIICTATTSPTPVFSDKNISEGTHINAVGAYQPDKREIPGDTLQTAKIIVDQRAACMSEAGDVLMAIRDGLIDSRHIYAELGELVQNKKTPRENEKEITLFKSVGNAAQDLVTAHHVFAKALSLRVGNAVRF
jgi:ornithine cyclodeaminase/alanine dehydrogenase-like protein (mu-crystallin family)